MFISPSWQAPNIQQLTQTAEGIGVSANYEVQIESVAGDITLVAKFSDETSALAYSASLSWYLDIPEITGLL